MEPKPKPEVLFIEPFYGGSHKQLVDLLKSEFGGDLFTLPASKWHWRMRVAALHFSLTIPHHHSYNLLFASSVLNLCELTSLRPDLAKLHKILYFHENQLVYPVRKQQDRDFQYGYIQILSCLVADLVLFNSHFNMHSFQDSIRSHLTLIPDYRPKDLLEQIKPKCKVLYFPIQLHHRFIQLKPTKTSSGNASDGESIDCTSRDSGVLEGDTPRCTANTTSLCLQKQPSALQCCSERKGCIVRDISPFPLHILWPHRWEHDKGPEEFCAVLMKLVEADFDFRVSFLGGHTNDIPVCIQTVIPKLGHRLLHQGHLPTDEYWRVLQEAHVVVSTAKHEFFGVAMLEATYCGCYPLCPNRLVYPEIYPAECLYNTEQQLFKKLKRFCQNPHIPIMSDLSSKIRYDCYLWSNLKAEYSKVLQNDD